MIGTTNLARTDASHLVFNVGELPATGLRGLLELLLSIVSSSPSTLGFCPYTTYLSPQSVKLFPATSTSKKAFS
jgi:hypothetical protein